MLFMCTRFISSSVWESPAVVYGRAASSPPLLCCEEQQRGGGAYTRRSTGETLTVQAIKAPPVNKKPITVNSFKHKRFVCEAADFNAWRECHHRHPVCNNHNTANVSHHSVASFSDRYLFKWKSSEIFRISSLNNHFFQEVFGHFNSLH